MIKKDTCKCCGQARTTEYICDWCGADLSMYDICLSSPPIKIRINLSEYDFCNLMCAAKFIIIELEKIKKGEK